MLSFVTTKKNNIYFKYAHDFKLKKVFSKITCKKMKINQYRGEGILR